MGALVVGLVLFVFLYWMVPTWFENNLAKLEGNMFLPIVEARFHYLIRACQWTAVACLLVGLYFAIRNAYIFSPSQKGENRLVAILARLLGRSIE